MPISCRFRDCKALLFESRKQRYNKYPDLYLLPLPFKLGHDCRRVCSHHRHDATRQLSRVVSVVCIGHRVDPLLLLLIMTVLMLVDGELYTSGLHHQRSISRYLFTRHNHHGCQVLHAAFYAPQLIPVPF